ncbi:MAG: FAD:protein FMN transferase [Pirellulales bacterium]|nr:FAD:protein FMN transferase [Pirellulales bacterium]
MADSHRRDFITGKSWPAAAREMLDRQFPHSPLTTVKTEYLLSYTRRAMACDFSVWLPADASAEATTAALAALDLVENLEAQLTIYQSTSEISRINELAATEPVVVESRLFELLCQARTLWSESRGAYDITSGPLSEVWGFSRKQGRLPSEQEISAALTRVGSQHLQLNPRDHTVRFLQPGLTLNLASIGKGYALDRCAEIFAAAGVERYLLHGGNSSLLARAPLATEIARESIPGTPPPLPVKGPDNWWIGVRDPYLPDQRILEVNLRNRAAGTSGAAVQHFWHQGKRYGHILDPRTGWPAETALSATVLAPTSAMADAISTACYVLGAEGAAELLATQPGVAALIFSPGKKASEWELTTLGLDPADLRQVS